MLLSASPSRPSQCLLFRCGATRRAKWSRSFASLNALPRALLLRIPTWRRHCAKRKRSTRSCRASCAHLGPDRSELLLPEMPESRSRASTGILSSESRRGQDALCRPTAYGPVTYPKGSLGSRFCGSLFCEEPLSLRISTTGFLGSLSGSLCRFLRSGQRGLSGTA